MQLGQCLHDRALLRKAVLGDEFEEQDVSSSPWKRQHRARLSERVLVNLGDSLIVNNEVNQPQ
jgi:hypothetical protein